VTKFDHFDLISPLYDLVFGRRTDLEIVEIADVRDDQTLLDVGGGTGRVGVLFQNKIKKIVNVDSSFNMLKEAKNKGLTNVNSNSEKLPFADETFHRVIIVDAFHHVKNQKKTLKEMWRVLKEDGKIIIEEPDINNFFVKLIALGEKILLMRSHFIAPGDIAEMSQFSEKAIINIKRKNGIAWIIIQKDNARKGKKEIK